MRYLATLTVVSVLFAAGCSSDSSEVEVTGKVTLDEQPVGSGNEAQIQFEPTASGGKPAQAFIDKGEYSLRVAPGAYKVAVTWNRPTGKKVARSGVKGPGSEKDELVAEIPAKYNTASKLTAEVSPDKRRHDFQLKK